MPVMAFTSRWPKEVKAAVLDRVLKQGDVSRGAWERAREGRLVWKGEQLDAQPELPLGTVRDWCRDERARQAVEEKATLGPDSVMTTTTGMLVAIHAREVEKAKRRAHQGKLEPRTIAELAKAGAALELLVRAVSRSNGTLPAPDGDAKRSAGQAAAQRPDGFLDALADDPDA